MADLNTGEYGQVIRVNLGQDISAGTNLTVILEPKRGEKQTKTSNVVVGTSNVEVGDEKYLANEYLEYTIQEGDLDANNFDGIQWRVKGEAIVSGVRVVGDYRKISVMP